MTSLGVRLRQFTRLVAGLAVGVLLIGMAHAQTAATGERHIEWLTRPWELRYVLYVSDHWAGEARVSREWNLRADPRRTFRSWQSLFGASSFHQSRDKWARPGDGLTVVLIEFDRDGKVTTPHHYDAPLYGRIDRLLYIALTPSEQLMAPRFHLGDWFMGLGDISTHWAPGLCGIKNMPSPFSHTDTSYLYGPKFDPHRVNPTFGCREWAYQLGDLGRPYIDITSYYPKKSDPDGPGTYVHEAMGWSRFSDAPKPVIGKHENDWFCLYDCPNGAPPGRIDDIKEWATRNGWAMPRRPTRVPVFPDPPARSGTYPQ